MAGGGLCPGPAGHGLRHRPAPERPPVCRPAPVRPGGGGAGPGRAPDLWGGPPGDRPAPPGLSGTELEFILAHEGVHARRRDNLWNYAVAAALVLYWWDPAVWLMARPIRRDVELSCDRAVLARLGGARWGDYARALLAFATQGERFMFSRPFGQKQAEERIVAIMKLKKTSLISMTLSLALIATTTVTFATSPVKADSETAPVEPIVLMEADGEPVAKHGDLNHGVVDGVTPVGSSVEGVDESGLDLSRSVSISTDFTVKVGASFIRTFNTGNLFVEDHNAFKVIVSDTNGAKYRYVIVNDQGWSYESPEYTVDSSVTITNAFSDQTFTVYIVNTGAKELTGHVKISSFYNN